VHEGFVRRYDFFFAFEEERFVDRLPLELFLPERAELERFFAVLWLLLLRLVERFDVFGGTLAPSRRASESPIAIACLREVTFLPERPERSLPCFFSRMDRSTFSDAFLPYLAIALFLLQCSVNYNFGSTDSR
jgi:hypothetical protein